MMENFICGGSPRKEDRHALELAEYTKNKKEEVEIYVDHLVSSAQVIELVEEVNGDEVTNFTH